MDDPESRSMLYVMQYLHDCGYNDALGALERQVGLLHDPDKLPRGGHLMALVYKEMEDEVGGAPDADAALQQAEEQELLRAGKNDYASQVAASLEDAHPANVLCVRLWPGRQMAASGSADGVVRLLRLNACNGDTLEWECALGRGGVLSLAWHPGVAAPATGDGAECGGEAAPPSAAAPARAWLLAGTMDGSVALLDAAGGGEVLALVRPHTKYVVRVVASPDGQHMASCSYDQSVVLHRLVAGAAGSPAGSPADEAPDAGAPVQLQLVRRVQHTAYVQDCVFMPAHQLPDAGGGGGWQLLAAVRSSNYLWRCDGVTGEELPALNLNEDGCDHVSFSPMRLAASPCGRYLLVATDGPRLLMLRASAGGGERGVYGWRVVRAFYGLPHDKFHVPSLAWHRDIGYVYVGTAGAQVLVVHTGTAKEVARVARQHKVNVRDIDYDPVTNRLASCSFDKSVKVMVSAGERWNE